MTKEALLSELDALQGMKVYLSEEWEDETECLAETIETIQELSRANFYNDIEIKEAEFQFYTTYGYFPELL